MLLLFLLAAAAASGRDAATKRATSGSRAIGPRPLVSCCREKMRLWLPLLVVLSSCSSVTAATFQVNVTRQVYEAEENRDVLLGWTFSTSPDMKISSLNIYCGFFGPTESLVYRVVGGVEHPEMEDNSFTGRVQSDRDALGEGRISLHLSRVRRSDSGFYHCNVFTEGGNDSGFCRLNVSAAAVTPEPEPEPGPAAGAVGRQRSGLHVVLALSAAALLLSVFA